MMTNIPYFGAAALGCIIGWFIYYINRYRKGEVQFSDLTTVVGIVGGAGVTSIFGGADKALFGSYGVGLFVGFFGYFLALIVLVRNSNGVFGVTWFLDGRRRDPSPGESIPGEARQTVAPMAPDPRGFHGLNPAHQQSSVMLQPVVLMAAQAPPVPQPAHMPISEEFASKMESTMEHDPASCFCAALDVRPEGGAGVLKGKGRAALLNAAHWGDHRQLTVGFYGGSDAVRQRVVRHAQEWTRSGAGVKFHFWTDKNADPAAADIRVSFVQNGRSWSYLGTDARRPELRGQPTMNLGWLTESLSEERARAVILHEFGHALGLIHEHQNPHDKIDWDTDEVIADLSGPPNSWDRQTILSNMFKAYDPAVLFATDVDEKSIMMYPIKASWTKNGFSVAFNSRLSEHDISLIKAAYPPLGLG